MNKKAMSTLLKPLITAIVSALLAVLLSACSENYNSSITPTALNEIILSDDTPIIIDVRSETEFAEGHIPGAINIPFNQIDNVVNDVNDDKEEPVYIYCASGRRADIAASKLANALYTNIVHVEGDMPGWAEAGLPVSQSH